MRVYIIRAACIAMLLGTVMSCGYRFTGSDSGRFSPNQSIWVDFIRVEINGPSSLQTVLRRALLDEFHALRGITQSGSSQAADMRIAGKVMSYQLRPVSFNYLDKTNKYRLSVEVELEVMPAGGTGGGRAYVMSAFQDFPAGSDLALQRSAEEAALAAVSQKIAQRFIVSMEQDY